MQQYLDLLTKILDEGVDKNDRTGVGTRSIFGHQLRFDLHDGFPILTTKRVHFRSVVGELLWMLHGETNIEWLNDNGITIWDDWAGPDGELGPIYGHQWRSWPTPNGGVDQIINVINSIQTDPDSRRHIVSAWNVAHLDAMALPPCHVLFQFYVANGRLSCQIYQRSADVFLGLPFNIASYALLTHIIAQKCNLQVGELIHTLGDAHLYTNHLDQTRTQLARAPRPHPQLRINHLRRAIDDFAISDFVLDGYDPHPAIKAPVAI